LPPRRAARRAAATAGGPLTVSGARDTARDLPFPQASAGGLSISIPAEARARFAAIGWVETAVVAIMAVAIFAVYVWASHYWIDLIDEGYFVYLGSRVHAGDLPYRDFDTYYTPGIFYLYSWLFSLFGLNVMPVRILMSGVRVLWGLILYRLARRVVPWPFALLPFLIVAGVDSAPVFPEPHPAWIATLATLAVMETIARHQVSGARRWIVAAGVLAGIAFLFKQNTGAFAVLGIGAYLILRERRQIGKLLLVGQAGYVLVLGLAVTVLLWPGATPELALALWLPMLAVLGVLAWIAWAQARIGGWTDGLPALLCDGLATGGAFVVVTLAWMVPLALALGIKNVPWGLFAGAVNQGALNMPLTMPPPSTRLVLETAIWLPIGVALLAGRAGLPRRGILLGAAIASVLILFIPIGPPPADSTVEQPNLYPLLSFFEAELGDLFLYVPALCAWAGVAMLATAAARRTPVEPLGWYLLIGALLGLSFYPRMDVTHAMFSGPGLFVVGAWALAVVHRALVGHLSRTMQVLVYISLFVLPVTSLLPDVYWRYVTIGYANPRAPVPPPYVPLNLERAEVLVPDNVADGVGGAVRYIQAGTPPGQPFFAYPVDPLFNFLADRPNPTRFNHFIAYALTPSDMQDVIHDLDRAKPRYILWDHGGVVYFETGLTNGPLSDYIWGCYQQVANFTPYLILERRCP
jgi:hypothetical protein